MRRIWKQAGVVLVVALLLPCLVLGQVPPKAQADEKLAFEVASVKPNKSENPARGNFPRLGAAKYEPNGGLFSATNFELALYIYVAYDLNGNQMKDVIAGLPQWVFSERFDIQARAASQNPTLDEVRMMLRSLLRDRFKLEAHYETRQSPVYALVQEKSGRLGPSLQRHPADADCSAKPPYVPAKADAKFPALCGGTLPMTPTVPGHAKSGARNVTMELFASFLKTMGNLDRPVLDRTGLTGTFDWALEWTPDFPALPGLPGAGPQSGPVDSRPDVQGQPFAEALRDQLGLKLEPSQSEVQVLLIDHIEHPAAN
jgi:uncharacterized protein (TIGR03435 family)